MSDVIGTQKGKEGKMKVKQIMAVAVGLVLTAGCISDPATFCASSIPIEQGKYSVLAEEVTGTHTEVNWLFFTFGLGGSGQRHALNAALAQIPGTDALVSMATDTETFFLIPFALPTFFTTRVSGTPVKVHSEK